MLLTSAHRNRSARQREFQRSDERHDLRDDALFTEGANVALGLLTSSGN